MRRRMALVALVLALLGSACGGDGGGDEGGVGSSGDGIPPAEVEATAAALAAQLGGEGAFIAVVLAVDAGYTVGQLVGAIVSPDGAVVGEEPFGPPLGVLDRPDGAAPAPEGGGDGEGAAPAGGVVLVAAGQQGEDDEPTTGRPLTEAEERIEFAARTLQEIYLRGTFSTLSRGPDGELALAEGQLAYEQEARMALGVLSLLARGYPLDDAISALVLGTAVDGGGACWFIRDESPVGRDLLSGTAAAPGECPTVAASQATLDELEAANPGGGAGAGGGPVAGGGPSADPGSSSASAGPDGAWAGTLDRDAEIFTSYLDGAGGSLVGNQAEAVVVDGVLVELSASFEIAGVRRSGCSTSATFTLVSDESAAVVDGVARLGGSARLVEPRCEGGAIDATEPVAIEVAFAEGTATMTFTFPAGTVRTATLERAPAGP